jgi:hypothetical protein
MLGDGQKIHLHPSSGGIDCRCVGRIPGALDRSDGGIHPDRWRRACRCQFPALLGVVGRTLESLPIGISTAPPGASCIGAIPDWCDSRRCMGNIRCRSRSRASGHRGCVRLCCACLGDLVQVATSTKRRPRHAADPNDPSHGGSCLLLYSVRRLPPADPPGPHSWYNDRHLTV